MTKPETAAELGEAPPKLNKKNILEDIGDFIDANQFADEDEGDEQLPTDNKAEEEPENALLDIIDVGLDFAEDFLHEAGYPALKRKIWEDRGRAAMNKALNAYLPAGSAAGGVLDTPLAGLLIGLLCLGVCFYPVIAHYVKTRTVVEDAEQPLPEPDPMPQVAAPAPDAERQGFTITETKAFFGN